MPQSSERIRWLLLVAIAVSVAGFIGYTIARQKYKRKAIGNLDLLTLVCTKTLIQLHENPDHVRPMPEETLDVQAGRIWQFGKAMPETKNTLISVRQYRTQFPDYSSEPNTEQGLRFQQTQRILKRLQP